MRIAYICMDPGVPVFGKKGCSVHVQEVIRAFVRAGAQVELFAARKGGDVPPGLENVVLHKLPSLPKGDPAVRELAAIAANQDLLNLLNKSDRFDLVYERYALWSFAGMEFAAQAGNPGVLEVNAPLIEEQAKHRGLTNREIAEEVAARVFTAAHALVCVSKEVADYVAGRKGDSDQQNVHIVPNAVNPDRFAHALSKTEKQKDSFVVGFVGTLKPWHGLSYLLEAFAEFSRDYPRAKLLIVGDGPQREQVVALAEENGTLQAIDMVGSVPPEKVPGLLASMDVAVAPYPQLDDFYFSPLKVYEYMAAGLPVIASRIGQLETLVNSGVNGILSEPSSAGSIASSLTRLYKDKALRQSMGNKARASVLQHHTWDKVGEQIFDIAGLDIRAENQAEAV